MLAKKIVLISLCLICFVLSYAQVSQITGLVLGAEKNPLNGITVTLKNTKIATKTNSNGVFTLKLQNAISNKIILVFSGIGFETLEAEADKFGVLNVTLKEGAFGLNDVVVVGYGSQKKKDVTGSVSRVDIVDLQKAPVRSFEEALGGRVAGVQVSSADGQPGAVNSIVIRGGNSLTQDNSPLYVVDGFPLENPNNNAINPNDIESIDILKDASATAIYGARAANGVIMITTKKGAAGKAKFSFNTFYGNQSIINKLPVLTPYEFVKYQFEYDSASTKSTYLGSGQTIDDYKKTSGVDWQDQVFRTAPIYNNSLSISGGNQSFKYFGSFSVIKQDGIVKNSGYDRYQGRFRFDNTINEKLKLTFNINYSSLKGYGTVPSQATTSSQTSNLMYSVWGYRPVSGNAASLLNGLDPLFEGDPNDARFNPVETVTYEVRNRFSKTLITNLLLEYEIIKNLKFKTSLGYTNDVDRNEEFNGSKTRGGSPNTVGGRTNGINGSFIYINTTNYLFENTLSYFKKLKDKSTLDAVLGVTIQGVDKFSNGAAASRLPNERLGLAGLDEGTPTRVPSTKTGNTLASFLGRANYSFDGKYLATVSFRSDGSSKFSTNNKWSFFPSASFAWRVSQEKFLDKAKWLNDLKLRVGYGLVGNNRVSDYAYLSSLNSPSIFAYPFNGTTSFSTLPNTLGNPNLKWETTGQTNIGLDFAVLKNRVSIVVDLYRKVTKDLLLFADLPPSSGFTQAFKNIGSIENKGLEISITSKVIDKSKFKWSSSFNISFNRNKILSLNDGQEALQSTINWDNDWRGSSAYIAKVGQPAGQMFGYIWDGNYQYSDFDKTPSGVYTLKTNVASNTTTANNRIQPGFIKYKDLNGDLVMNDNDRTILGNAAPNFFGGFTNNFSYANFDLSVFFQYSSGGKILNANKYVFEGNSGRRFQNQYTTVLNRWSDDNQNNEMFITKGDGDKVYSSRAVEDASYIRLKTIQLSYNIKPSFLKRFKINSARVFASAQNILTWTNYSGFDPEVSAYNSALTPGFDYSVYPRAKTYTIGINLDF